MAPQLGSPASSDVAAGWLVALRTSEGLWCRRQHAATLEVSPSTPPVPGLGAQWSNLPTYF